jgi:hypothetical protein
MGPDDQIANAGLSTALLWLVVRFIGKGLAGLLLNLRAQFRARFLHRSGSVHGCTVQLVAPEP